VCLLIVCRRHLYAPVQSRVCGSSALTPSVRIFAWSTLIAGCRIRFRLRWAWGRCGFAAYFRAGQGLDHGITEFRDGDGRWVRIDPEIPGGTVLDHPGDLRPGEFLGGGKAWAAFRRGAIDAARFGVCGTGNRGPAEIRGNAVKDLAALNKAGMLPWDERGRMTAAYRRDSSTSPRPSSSDSPYRKKNAGRPLRERGKRRPGKQPGGPGTTMNLVDNPDESPGH
jgi:hypothetical protein